MDGLARRDALVYDYAQRNGVPVASALAGGYARSVADTVSIHIGTILAAREAARAHERMNHASTAGPKDVHLCDGG